MTKKKKMKKEKDQNCRSLEPRVLHELSRELNRPLAPGEEGSNREVEQLEDRASSLPKTLAAKTMRALW